jgi:hypothetical protein
VAGGDVGGEFLAAAAEILDERVPGGQDPRGPVALKAAQHLPRFQLAGYGGRAGRMVTDGGYAAVRAAGLYWTGRG